MPHPIILVPSPLTSDAVVLCNRNIDSQHQQVAEDNHECLDSLHLHLKFGKVNIGPDGHSLDCLSRYQPPLTVRIHVSCLVRIRVRVRLPNPLRTTPLLSMV